MTNEDKRITAAVVARIASRATWTDTPKSKRTLRIRIATMTRAYDRQDAATMKRFAMQFRLSHPEVINAIPVAVQHAWRAVADWDTQLRRKLFLTHPQCPKGFK